MAGALRSVFGVCASEWSPSDGTIGSGDQGCGDQSETDVRPREPGWQQSELVIDHTNIEIIGPTEAAESE